MVEGELKSPKQSEAGDAQAIRGSPDDIAAAQDKAARTLQRVYRGYTERRTMAGFNLTKPRPTASIVRRRKDRYDKDVETFSKGPNTSQRWGDAINAQQISKQAQNASDTAKSDPKERWKRTAFYAQKISEGNVEHSHQEERDGLSKDMEPQYWLEIVDTKHRYGTNLKHYHDYWNNESNTNQNFFYWLDQGEGKNLDLPQCPRERLEKEQLTYLNAEQRRNYLVLINEEGRLVWARNGEKVNTSRSYKNLPNGQGIAPAKEVDAALKNDGSKETNTKEETGEKDASRQRFSTMKTNQSEESFDSSSDSGSEFSSGGEFGPGDKEHHEGHYDSHKAEGGKMGKMTYWVSPRAVWDVLLRKTLRGNMWIFVADLDYNLYIGLKETGNFQHSSFLFGSRVRAAGMCRVQDGQLRSLSPLSGHYRTGTAHFKQFCDHMAKQGVDMSRVNISKSLMIIGGIEKYAAIKKKTKKVKTIVQHKVLNKPTVEEKEKKEEETRNEKIEKNAAKTDDQGATHPLDTSDNHACDIAQDIWKDASSTRMHGAGGRYSW